MPRMILLVLGAIIALLVAVAVLSDRDADDAVAGTVEALGAGLALVGMVALGLGSGVADLFATLGGLFAEAPVAASYVATVILGAMSLGWLEGLAPAAIRDMPPTWWFGVTLFVLGVAFAVRDARGGR